MLKSFRAWGEIKSIEAAQSEQISVVIRATRLGAVKILHIEDDLSVARAISKVLRLRGFEVASAATRDDVVRHLDVTGFRPDLILTDYQLGEGLTAEIIVAEIAARLHFKPPIILITGISGPQVKNASSYADRVLAKPVDIQVLLREINELLATRHSSERQVR
jgi:DNA-binding response OmpR family regulator